MRIGRSQMAGRHTTPEPGDNRDITAHPAGLLSVDGSSPRV
ncbi:hypothetical protein [Streptomyces tauricus]|nr:hypothetical protein [Streptomyces tauricus]MCW8103383.1 hypothetical protein [Streptomyces tauricus]